MEVTFCWVVRSFLRFKISCPEIFVWIFSLYFSLLMHDYLHGGRLATDSDEGHINPLQMD